MNVLLAAAAEAAEEHHNELPIPPAAFGVVAFAVLMTLLFVAFAFRSVGSRH